MAAQRSEHLTIAIDGPAASGKSTTARNVAKKLGYTYIDSGAMYRAVAREALEKKVSDEESLARLAEELKIEFRGNAVFADGVDVSEPIRTPEVSTAASMISRFPKVRSALVAKQRALGIHGGVVMDGRDIGTVVFPNADVKIFLIADADKRAERRVKELQERGASATIETISKEIRDRDRADETREASPLVKAPDAIEVDTTSLTIDEQVEKILELVKKKQLH